jgi:hypothetical protein
VASGPATLRHQHSSHRSIQAKPKSNRDVNLHQVLGACQRPLVCLAIPAFDCITGLSKNSLYHN